MTDVDRLADLLDVLTINPQVGDALKFNGTKWVNGLANVPVGCILSADPIDAHPNGSKLIEWNQVYDNNFSFNPLPGFPSGLGLSLAGSLFTLTDTGCWLYEISLLADPDADVRGTLSCNMALAAFRFGPVEEFGGNTFYPGCSGFFAGEAAQDFNTAINVFATSIANPYMVTPYMSISRVN